jgi:hypothetical protein
MEGGDNQDKKTGVDEGRRRISKAAAASPVLASLASPSVWGTVCSVSGLQSGNTSGHNHDECEGSGCTPGYWKNHPDAWPAGFSPGICTDPSGNGGCKAWSYDGATPISAILDGKPVSIFGDYGYSDDTAIMYILQKEVSGGGNTNSKLAHWIAAVFNAIVAPMVYGSSVDDLFAALDTAVTGTPFDVVDLVDVLTRMNEAGECFLSGGSGNAAISCSEFNGVQYIYDPDSGTCIPACPAGQRFDWETKTCKDFAEATDFATWCANNGSDPACLL